MSSTSGRRRALNDSKLATTMRAIVFFSLVAGVVFVSKPLWDKPKGPSADSGTTSSGTPALLSVRYKSGADPTATTSAVQPWLQVVNASQQNIDLGTVTLRYYFTQDGSQAYAASCIYAEVGCSNIAEQIVPLPAKVPGADHYLQVTFTAAAGTLKPKDNSGAIELELYAPGGAALKQTADLSFTAQTSSYKPNAHITGFVGNALAWGTQPSGSNETAPSGKPAADLPDGVLFDDFHYSGAADAALNKHGWVVRNSGGGPGINDTWSPSGVTFPNIPGAQGGQVIDLRATTDGSKSGTTQAEIDSLNIPFFTGTYAARIHFNDQPSSGTNGDPINEDFYMLSPRNNDYSEMDAEYQPNGGWGAKGPRLDTTTWFSVFNCDKVVTSTSVLGCDRQTKVNKISLNGWHTLLITAGNGTVTYYMDGNELFSTTGKYYPREAMSADFNAWFVDLKKPITGTRVWDMEVNWFYYNSKQVLTLDQVQQDVGGLYSAGNNFVDTISKQ